MHKRLIALNFLACLMIGISGTVKIHGDTADFARNLRKDAAEVYDNGNYDNAYQQYRRLLFETDNPSPGDLHMAVNCLRRLGRITEFDTVVEKAVTAHPDKWQMLKAAARAYQKVPHRGMLIANEFERGARRGGGQRVFVFQRDRVRALQLLEKARELIEDSGTVSTSQKADFYINYARFLREGRQRRRAWRLQYLTDITDLPDYSKDYYAHRGATRGAPVDENDEPVFYEVPDSFEEAVSDGERWRWLLNKAKDTKPGLEAQVMMTRAQFLQSQFGVQTMRRYNPRFGAWGGAQENDNAAQTFQLRTLAENETLARLATGIRRFDLPDEHNYIRIYQNIISDKTSSQKQSALRQLAEIFENRRQYPKAAEYWTSNIEQFGPGSNQWKEQRLNQIEGNWGEFETARIFPAGKPASILYRFRNATAVELEAHRIDVPQLIQDVKDYLKSDPGKIDSKKLRIERIGWRLIHKDETKYIEEKIADWTEKLEPRPNHFDRRVEITTPLKAAGAYLLKAKLADGNISRIIVWIEDTSIVRKNLEDRTYYFVADAATGRPLAKANVEFFGYRLRRHKNSRNYDVLVDQFAEYTDDEGQVLLKNSRVDRNFTWLTIATTEDDRFAYSGFSRIWHSRRHDREYKATKVFTITDRPVYRPDQTVKFKLWVRHAQYDKADVSQFAEREFKVEIRNPRNEKILDKTFTADEYGGINGELKLEDEPVLGNYRIHIPGRGGGRFRVEEYKKPEFEVKVKAPDKPVRLGEKIESTIKAEYYFGSPVTNATVKYKVTRTPHDTRWYPPAPWDWFYGRGYWWFAADYSWYPGWSDWAVSPPIWPWLPQPHHPPEVVAENEVPIGADGTVKVPIDTLPAKELHGDTDHQYKITAEVRDESRRTIVGTGKVIVTREPFEVYVWLNRGHYQVGETVHANFQGRTADNKPVEGDGRATLYRLSYDDDREPIENEVREWDIDTNVEGAADLQLKASRPGQYRLEYQLTDSEEHTIEGGYVFTVRGKGFDGRNFRFNHLEIVPEKREYAPGEKVRLMINTDQAGATVVLFTRPTNGVYLPPEILHLEGKSEVYEITVTKKDMPNFYVEAFTISDARVHTVTREIVIPPEKRVLDIEVMPSAAEFKPGEEAKVELKVTDFDGKPFQGSLAISMYDRSVEYIAGGSNVPKIKEFFWKWRRHHTPRTYTNLDRYFSHIGRRKEEQMRALGVFGESVADDETLQPRGSRQSPPAGIFGTRHSNKSRLLDARQPGRKGSVVKESAMAGGRAGAATDSEAKEMAEPKVRKEFADTAYWNAGLETDANGLAEFTVEMPENLTGWKIKAWGMGHGTRVGEGETKVVTRKNIILRMQSPRFFVEKDEVVLSANIHNYLDTDKKVRAVLELDGDTLSAMVDKTRTLTIPAGGEKRVDWRVKAVAEGEAVVRMKALTDEESDAMQMSFPVYVHGMDKMVSFSGALRPERTFDKFTFEVPAERREEQTRFVLQYSPTLAGAMVDALPYLVEYPHGCTEQTLNRFVPTVITQKILLEMGLNLEDIREKQTNLNTQELGEPAERAKQWKRWDRNPVFNQEKVEDMVKKGVRRLTAMQLSDGGWGWFSGYGEHSAPHTTATVVHGLQQAKANDVAIPPQILKRGVKWLEAYQSDRVKKLQKAEKEEKTRYANNIDAFVYMVLVDGEVSNAEMRRFLYRDRTHLSVYAKAMFGLALEKQGHADQLNMIMKNMRQYLVEDKENQTAYLKLPNQGYWWYWYGSEVEANSYYLKLLARTKPKSPQASGLAKYLLNNRKHATYWNSTRDTALAIEALADFWRASGEAEPNLDIEILIDGEKLKSVHVDKSNLFSFDNALILTGSELAAGEHSVEIRKSGTGPLYHNAYLNYFTLEDFITKAGLEVKVERIVWKLTEVQDTEKVAGSRGQALDQKVTKYEKTRLDNLDELTSGDMVEVELIVESKNDYEYIIIEDMKAAGFEPVNVRSGYTGDALGSYRELRDERAVFFVRSLPRGKHSLSYRLRAEIPGKFSALPARISAMYAPELRGNSDEIKLEINDQ
ncbi:MAG: MG2 domain-containing protein [Lentisphaeria bacterium]